MKKKLILTIFASLVVFSLYSNFKEEGRTSRSVNPSKVIEIGAYKLYNDYANNGVLATHKYRGKNVIVTGKITSIRKGVEGKTILFLLTSSRHNYVVCHMQKSQLYKVMAFNKGSMIKVAGRVKDKVLNSILISQGEIIE